MQDKTWSDKNLQNSEEQSTDSSHVQKVSLEEINELKKQLAKSEKSQKEQEILSDKVQKVSLEELQKAKQEAFGNDNFTKNGFQSSVQNKNGKNSKQNSESTLGEQKKYSFGIEKPKQAHESEQNTKNGESLDMNFLMNELSKDKNQPKTQDSNEFDLLKNSLKKDNAKQKNQKEIKSEPVKKEKYSFSIDTEQEKAPEKPSVKYQFESAKQREETASEKKNISENEIISSKPNTLPENKQEKTSAQAFEKENPQDKDNQEQMAKLEKQDDQVVSASKSEENNEVLEDKKQNNAKKDTKTQTNVGGKKKSHSHKNPFEKEQGPTPPEVSLPDDITEEDILRMMQENSNVEKQEEEENFEGLTPEEIEVEKERRRRFNELRHKYNEPENKQKIEIGDYKKNLDFTVNKDIKHFRIKPRKKVFVIASLIVILLAGLGVALTFLLLNRPAPPVRLVSMRLSQTTTYQYVGEKVDLRGLYVQARYSNGSIKTIPVTEQMIASTSPNINAFNVISSASGSPNVAKVSFEYNGTKIEQDLTIILTQTSIKQISSVQIYQEEISTTSLLKFDNILILANVVDSLSGEHLETKRIFAKDATYFINAIDQETGSPIQIELEKTNEGVKLDKAQAGTTVLTISYQVGDKTLTYKIDNFKIF